VATIGFIRTAMARGGASLLAIAVATFCSPALAQEPEAEPQDLAAVQTAQSAPEQPAPEAGESASLGEIIVVATRRDQALQDVPLAVTAIGQDALRLNQVDSISDVGSLTPNMITVAGTAGGAKSAPQFSIRGQSQQERGGLSDPSVSVYFGDVVIARTQGLNQTLFDIRSVEVIRGPVGTLFGKNATGGAVIIRPNLPNTKAFEGSAGVTIAEFDTINADAYVNLPASDSVAFRFGASISNSDGYIFDETLGRNVNDTDTISLRGSALFRLGRLENVTMVNYFTEDDGGSGGFARFLNPQGSIATLAALRNYRPVAELLAEQDARGSRRINNGTPEFNVVETVDIHNTTTFEVADDITLKNIFGWRKVDSHILVDLDGTEHPVLHTEIFDDSKQISNELQLIGKSGAIDWIVGGYFFNESGDNNASSLILRTESGGVESSTTFLPGATNNRQKFENTSYAVFAEGTYEILNGLSATLGGRYTWDKREATILNRVINTRFRLHDRPRRQPIDSRGQSGRRAGMPRRRLRDLQGVHLQCRTQLQARFRHLNLRELAPRLSVGRLRGPRYIRVGSAPTVQTGIRAQYRIRPEAGLAIRRRIPPDQPRPVPFKVYGRPAPGGRYHRN
jgi:iron complex outermembrane recepter protein